MSKINEELISAYLDHEVSTEERELVEAALARDPNLQKLKDELELLREGFDLLPVYHAHDLEDVLQQAVGQARTPQPEVKRPAGTNHRKIWFTACASLAACLLVMITLLKLPRDTKEEQLALAEDSSGLSPEPHTNFQPELFSAESDLADGAVEAAEAPEGMAGGFGGVNNAEVLEAETLSSALHRSAPENSPALGAPPRAANSAHQRAAVQGGLAAQSRFNADPNQAKLVERSRLEADQVFNISVSRNELSRLFDILDPPVVADAPEKNSDDLESATIQPKSLDNVAPSVPLQEKQAKSRPDVTFAVNQTPDELVSLLGKLQAKQYFADNDDKRNEYVEAKDRYTDLLKRKMADKLRVLFLITIEPAKEPAEQQED